jgi:predicted kinase
VTRRRGRAKEARSASGLPALLCGPPPGERPDWATLEAELPWLRALERCQQNPVHHGEGDVLIHTRRVCEALCALPDWSALDEPDRQILFCAALLHDLGKPATTRSGPDGRLRSPGHAARGAREARRAIVELDPFTPVLAREAVVALVRLHGLPPNILAASEPEAQRAAIAASYRVRCDQLALLAEADVRGRVADDVDRLLERVELFRVLCEELRCLRAPRPFASDAARVLYFCSERDPDRPAPPGREPACEVVVLAGLPGSGKDRLAATELWSLPMVSLDRIRAETGIGPLDRQGRVADLARQRARDLLRAREPFVWNATNLTRQLRGRVIALMLQYGITVRVIYLEAPLPELLRRNRARVTGAVPESAVRHLLSRLELPDLSEAHRVEIRVF